jgi:hypothetical protein
MPYNFGRGRQFYCSKLCGTRANAQRAYERIKAKRPLEEMHTKICPLCGNGFDTVVTNKKFCSIVCRKRYRNRNTDRKNLINSKKKRTPCICCGFKILEAIHRHHLDISQGNGGGVVCLCANCHTIYHYLVGQKMSKAASAEEVVGVINSFISSQQ